MNHHDLFPSATFAPLPFKASASALGRALRILVVLPFYGGSLPVGRHCLHALRELGHHAEPFEAPSFFSAFSALKTLNITADRLEQLENGFLNVMSQAVLAKVQTFEPDLVLSMAQAPLNRQALKRLRGDGVATAMWFVEDSRLFTYWRAFAPAYDAFFVIQREPLLTELADMGVTASYLPMAALPSLQRPLELAAAERHRFGSDVSFLGAGYPNRRVAFRQFTDLRLKIWGTEWEGESLLAPFIQAEGARISSEDSVKIFNASAININLHSSVQARELVPAGDFVNPRTFEVAACGAFQLVDARTLLPPLFTPDEMITFTSLEELRQHIHHYLPRPEERAAVAARARARVLAEHTYAHRMDTLLNVMGHARGAWPAARATALPDNLPQHIRQQLADVLDRLELPASAPFDEVIARLRQASGQLSEMDVALLFLDEWNKQYRPRQH